jgi:hypothetical protein
MLIPLNKVDVRANILDGIAKVVVTCQFVNLNEFPVNPIHCFSLDMNATIHNLKISIGDRLLTSTIKEKNDAKRDYMTAVKSGFKASVLEKLSDNEYKLSLGNVNSHENVNVIIEYVTTLDCNSNGSYIFVFPTNISVKYFSNDNINVLDRIYQQEMNKMIYSNNAAHSYIFGLTWCSANKILGVEAPTDICNIEYADDKLLIASTGSPISGDFSIAVKTEHKPCVYYYEDDKTQDIYTLTTIRVDKPSEVPEERLKKDFRIVVDCSGSMDSTFNMTTKMEATKNAVISFLNLLNPEDYFNITFFGSTYQRMLQSSVKATKESIFFATERIRSIGATLGGTELYDCLNDSIINTKNLDDVQCEKIVVIFTDGQIGNYTSLTSMIEENYNFCNSFSSAISVGCSDQELVAKRLINNRFRIFTIGFGNDVDRKLIKKLADITGGLYVYAKDSQRMEKTLEYIVSNINSKYYLNARLDDGENNTNKSYSAMYPNKNYIFVRKFSKDQLKKLEQNGLTLLCTNSKTNALVRCNMKFDKFIRKGVELKQLYNNTVIKSLEHCLEFAELNYTDYVQMTKKIISMSITENIMSKYTSFLIVDDKKTTFEPSVDVTIPQYSSNHVVYTQNSSSLGPRCEEVDTLEGGMDMFGGGGGYSSAYYTGEKDFVPYVTEIKRENLISSLNRLDINGLMYVNYEYCCYKSMLDLEKSATNENMSTIMYYNSIMYFELMKYDDLHDHAYQLLSAICKFDETITVFLMLKIKNNYAQYIKSLVEENNRRRYVYHPAVSWGGGGDY